MEGTLETYDERRAAPDQIPYRVPVAHRFTDDERGELGDLLDVDESPYTDYAGFREAVRAIASGRAPRFLRDLCASMRDRSLLDNPVVWLKNCPVGEVPVLDFDDPLRSKYELKKDFVAEAFLAVFTELHGTHIVTYRTANRGDMFHDITPMKKLAYTITQKTVNTLHFHRDLPNNNVRPDWVYLLAMRNSPLNEVYTPIVRLRDVFASLPPAVLATLEQPLFVVPRPVVEGDISNYGRADAALTAPAALVVRDRGFTFLAFHEGCTESVTGEGRAAIEALRAVLHRLKHDVFLDEGDFIALSNNTCMHARHVVRVADMEAHRRRWLLKTWNVDDIEVHRPFLMPDRIDTADE